MLNHYTDANEWSCRTGGHAIVTCIDRNGSNPSTCIEKIHPYAKQAQLAVEKVDASKCKLLHPENSMRHLPSPIWQEMHQTTKILHYTYNVVCEHNPYPIISNLWNSISIYIYEEVTIPELHTWHSNSSRWRPQVDTEEPIKLTLPALPCNNTSQRLYFNYPIRLR